MSAINGIRRNNPPPLLPDAPKQGGGVMARGEKVQNLVQNLKDFQLAKKQGEGYGEGGGGLWLPISLIITVTSITFDCQSTSEQ